MDAAIITSITHTVPITEYSIARGYLEFELPGDCDLIENIVCDQPEWTTYLRGAGADKISLKNLQIWMANALFSKMIIVVKIPKGESVDTLTISYKGTVYEGQCRNNILLKNKAIATRLLKAS